MNLSGRKCRAEDLKVGDVVYGPSWGDGVRVIEPPQPSVMYRGQVRFTLRSAHGQRWWVRMPAGAEVEVARRGGRDQGPARPDADVSTVS